MRCKADYSLVPLAASIIYGFRPWKKAKDSKFSYSLPVPNQGLDCGAAFSTSAGRLNRFVVSGGMRWRDIPAVGCLVRSVFFTDEEAWALPCAVSAQ